MTKTQVPIDGQAKPSRNSMYGSVLIVTKCVYYSRVRDFAGSTMQLCCHLAVALYLTAAVMPGILQLPPELNSVIIRAMPICIL